MPNMAKTNIDSIVLRIYASQGHETSNSRILSVPIQFILAVSYMTVCIDYYRDLPILWSKPADVHQSPNGVSPQNKISSDYRGLG